MTKTILALDLATRTGFAFGRVDGVPRTGSIRFGSDAAATGRRYRLYREWLSDLCNTVSPDVVCIEKPMPPSFAPGKTNLATLRLLIGLVEHTEELLYDSGIDVREASVSDIRHHFIGANPRGPEGKRLVMMKCRALGWNVEDDNCSDAAACWDYMRCIIRPDLAVRSTPLFRSAR